MTNPRMLTVLVVILAAASFAQDDKAPAAPSGSAGKKAKTEAQAGKDGDASESSDAKRPAATSQSAVASKTALFEKVAKDSESSTTALDAHDLAKAHEQV